jgi:hypothetical protein
MYWRTADEKNARKDPVAVVANFYVERTRERTYDFPVPPVVKAIHGGGASWRDLPERPELTREFVIKAVAAGIGAVHLDVTRRRTQLKLPLEHPNRFMDEHRFPDYQMYEFYHSDDRLSLVPHSLKKANEFVEQWHRHAGATAWNGGKFALAAEIDNRIVGVVIVGRPISRALADKWTLEVTRLCVSPIAPDNTCSFLYSAAKRAWQAQGGRKLLTYTLASESGGSLRGAGWYEAAKVAPKKNGWKSATRDREWKDVYSEPKIRWEVTC